VEYLVDPDSIIFGKLALDFMRPIISWTGAANATYTPGTGTYEFTTTSLTPGESHIVYVRAIDAVGRYSSSASFSFIVDTTAPSLTLNAPTDLFKGVRFTGTASDSESGIKSVEYRLSSDPSIRYSKTATYDPEQDTYSFVISILGDDIVYVRAVDNAGNYSVVRQYPPPLIPLPPGGIRIE
jgi:hypothetical protein